MQEALAAHFVRRGLLAFCGVCLKVNLWRALRCPVFCGLRAEEIWRASRVWKGLRAAECAQRETHRGPSSLVFWDYGLREEWCASRVLDGGLSRRRVRRFAPSALSTGVEMRLACAARSRLTTVAVVVPFLGLRRLFCTCQLWTFC